MKKKIDEISINKNKKKKKKRWCTVVYCLSEINRVNKTKKNNHESFIFSWIGERKSKTFFFNCRKKIIKRKYMEKNKPVFASKNFILVSLIKKKH